MAVGNNDPDEIPPCMFGDIICCYCGRKNGEHLRGCPKLN